MIPVDLEIDEREARFLGTDFIMARANLGTSTGLLVQAPAQYIEVGGEDEYLALIAPTYSGSMHLTNKDQEVEVVAEFATDRMRQYRGARELIEELAVEDDFEPRVIHFVGHGQVLDADTPAPKFQLVMSEGSLTLDEWREIVPWAELRPLLFLNACDLGQSSVNQPRKDRRAQQFGVPLNSQAEGVARMLDDLGHSIGGSTADVHLSGVLYRQGLTQWLDRAAAGLGQEHGEGWQFSPGPTGSDVGWRAAGA
jgi:hypothetical protein